MTRETPRSRRSILLAAAAGAAAATAATVARPARTFGADGDPVLLGGDNHSDSMTAITRDSINSPEDATFFAQTTISAAVVGHGTSGQGVIGRSETSAGVQGFSQTDAGVNGFGVFGVWAAGEAQGVFGWSVAGEGVHGQADTGTGGAFSSASGLALSTNGRLKFGGASGTATIAAGSATRVVSPGINLTGATFILLTPRGNLGGRDLWYTVDVAENKFTIRVSQAVSSSVSIGWLAIG